MNQTMSTQEGISFQRAMQGPSKSKGRMMILCASICVLILVAIVVWLLYKMAFSNKENLIGDDTGVTFGVGPIRRFRIGGRRGKWRPASDDTTLTYGEGAVKLFGTSIDDATPINTGSKEAFSFPGPFHDPLPLRTRRLIGRGKYLQENATAEPSTNGKKTRGDVMLNPKPIAQISPHPPQPLIRQKQCIPGYVDNDYRTEWTGGLDFPPGISKHPHGQRSDLEDPVSLFLEG